jgi:hypothetical protein
MERGPSVVVGELRRGPTDKTSPSEALTQNLEYNEYNVPVQVRRRVNSAVAEGIFKRKDWIGVSEGGVCCPLGNPLLAGLGWRCCNCLCGNDQVQVLDELSPNPHANRL